MATKKLTGEEKIISLANKLIKTINEQGVSVMRPDIAPDFGHVDIWIHEYGTEKSSVQITGIVNGWVFKGKPTKAIK
jgi:hypothetical protein